MHTPPFDAPVQLRVPTNYQLFHIIVHSFDYHIRYTVAVPHVAGHEDQPDQAVQFPSTRKN